MVCEKEGFGRLDYIDKTGKELFPFIYSDANKFRKVSQNTYRAIVRKKNDLFLIDEMGRKTRDFNEMTAEDKITELNWIDDKGTALLVKISKGNSTELYGLYSCSDGKFLVEPDCTSPIKQIRESYSNKPYYVFKKNGKYGLVKDILHSLKPVYDHIRFEDGIIMAYSNAKVENDQIVSADITLYDMDLKPLSEHIYESIRSLNEDRVWVKRDGKIGFINHEGVEVIAPEFNNAGDFSEGYATVFKENKAGVINKKGNVVIPFNYEDIGDFSNGVAYFRQKSLYGIIDTTGKIRANPYFEKIGNSSEGMLAFLKEKKIGFLNSDGDIVIEPKFDAANSFSEGLAMISIDKKVGFIDKKGTIVIPCQYDNADSFKDGVSLVVTNGTNYLIDKKGTVVKKYAK